MKKILLATVAVLWMTPAFAADLPLPSLKAPVMAQGYQWQDCYAAMLTGANTGTAQSGSGLAGGQIGCNYQTGVLVYGFEGDAAATNNSLSAPAPGMVDIKALTNISIRAGYAWHGLLTFGPATVTDALIYAKVGVPANIMDPTNTFQGGWGLGGGIEYPIAPWTTMRYEYRFDDIAGAHSHKLLTGLVVYYH